MFYRLTHINAAPLPCTLVVGENEYRVAIRARKKS